MKKGLFIIMFLIFNLALGQEKKKITDEEKLTKCILENTNYFTFSGQKPDGKGWDILENLFANNQFVAWGEYHNSPLLSQLTNYALESASKYGYKTWCVEISHLQHLNLCVLLSLKIHWIQFLRLPTSDLILQYSLFFKQKKILIC